MPPSSSNRKSLPLVCVFAGLLHTLHDGRFGHRLPSPPAPLHVGQQARSNGQLPEIHDEIPGIVPFSAPRVTRLSPEISATMEISASLSAVPVARVGRHQPPDHYSTRTWHKKESRTSLPLPFRNNRASGAAAVIDAWCRCRAFPRANSPRECIVLLRMIWAAPDSWGRKLSSYAQDSTRGPSTVK